MPQTDRQRFYDTVRAAVADIAAHGYDSAQRVERWLRLIRDAAEKAASSPEALERMLGESLHAAYRRLVERGGLIQFNKGVSRFTIARVEPHLRAELDRRIAASANLIKLNRKSAIEKTMQRFSGWATSIPMGGSAATNKTDTSKDVRKALASLPFEERRVIIDQGHKFASSLNDILATNSGAIAGRWHSNWRQANYNFREDHKERDSKIYAIRGSWAIDQGIITKCDGYTDEMTQAGEEIFCRCFYEYIYNLRDMPREFITAKGKAAAANLRVVT